MASDLFFVFPGWKTLRVFGPDAASWLHGIVTCDVKRVEATRGVWGSFLNKQGKICADLQIVGGQEELFVGVSGGDAGEVLESLDGLLVMEDAEIELYDGEWLLGSEAGALAGLNLGGTEPACLGWGKSEIYATLLSKPFHDALSSGVSQRCLGAEAWQEWLTDAGIPRFGVDYSSSDNPHAASLERRTVDWSKGCYLGQEVVCMQDMRGKVRRRLALLDRLSGPELSVGDGLTNEDGVVVGEVTSVGALHALARVRAPEFEEGTRLKSGETKTIVLKVG